MIIFQSQVLQVQCWKPLCSFINDIPTGSKHKVQGSSTKQAWDVNTKLAGILSSCTSADLFDLMLYLFIEDCKQC
jgi:hypothetical protein